jgi:hypothetical protein
MRRVTMRPVALSLVLLLTLLSIASAFGSPRPAPLAATACVEGSCPVFLPMATFSMAPSLIAPTSGALQISLAPVLSWTPLIPGKHLIQVSTDPGFSPEIPLPINSTKTVDDDPFPSRIDTQPTSNLKPLTTYFWRVGAPSEGGYAFSAVQSFTTPDKDSNLLPKEPVLRDPVDFEKLAINRVLLKWQSVPDALLYRISMVDANDESFDLEATKLPGTETTLWVNDLAHNMTYHWRVKVLNKYGWSSYSDYEYFRTP